MAGLVQYSERTKVEWGRNPMYSELDDHGDSWKTYPPPGRRFSGTGHTWIEGLKQDGKKITSTYAHEGVDWEYVLRDAGILGDDPTQDPDYVAGRFKSVDEWANFSGDRLPDIEEEPAEPDEPIGAIASAFVSGHDVTEEEAAALNATYTPITVGRLTPDPAADLGASAVDESSFFGDTWESKGPDVDWNAEPAPDSFDQAVDASMKYGGFPMEYMGPDGIYIGDEAAAAMHKAAQRAERQARAAERDRKHAEKEAARTVQTVPDAHPGATHIHDEPAPPEEVEDTYVPETHPLMHWDPDPSMPAHIPMDVVAQQIQEGVKVI